MPRRAIKAEQKGSATLGGVSYCISLERRMFRTRPFPHLHPSITSLLSAGLTGNGGGSHSAVAALAKMELLSRFG